MPRNHLAAVVALLVTITLAASAPQQPAPEPATADYRVQAVPMTSVKITDDFWRPRLETTVRVTIPHIFDKNEETGRVANFARAAKKAPGAYQGRRFNDSDVYKAVEAASYALAQWPDPVLSKRVDAVIALIAAAQERDGYLFPARTVDPRNPPPGVGPERWTFLSGSHELYSAGHLYEAAVAHQAATQSRQLLDVAMRNADLVSRTFGPSARHAVPGHQEIELALVRLYRATGERRYLDLAKFFLDERGKPHDTQAYPTDSAFAIYNDAAYRQDHAPVVSQERAVGHAVRAMYMYAGMTDIAALFGDQGYRDAVERLWRDVVSKRMYVTGGLGARSTVEAFGDDYELPNRSAYTETCAAVGSDLWNHRMFLLYGESRYLDVLERTLYNGTLSGVSLAGTTFFYQNPLESDGKVERTVYFEVACCPSNLARLLTQLPGLVYATRNTDLYVNLFVGSEADVRLGGMPVRITQRTRYPWEGVVRLRVELAQPPAGAEAKPRDQVTFSMLIRMPGWSRNQAVPSDLYRFAGSTLESISIKVNGQRAPLMLDRGFARIQRPWRSGDTVEVTFPMPVQRVIAHEGVTGNQGKVALQRGPLVYALEATDNGGRVSDILLPLDTPLHAEFRPDLLGGVTVITGKGLAAAEGGPTRERPIVAIPYYAWANRNPGEMAVWIPAK
jgi:DUF1680 family protein